jgi:hypothetical protein
MWRTWFAGILTLGLVGCSGAEASEPQIARAEPWRPGDGTWDRTLVVGTLIEATTCNEVDGSLTAMVSGDVRNARRWVVIPARSPVGLRIVPGRRAVIALDITSVTVAGAVYPLTATIALTPLVAGAGRDAAIVVSGTRILFVLRDGITVAGRGAASATLVASPFGARPPRVPPRNC